jgi:hypothetical protein
VASEFPTWFRPEEFYAEAFWASSVPLTLQRFLASYSLHDSEWLGVAVDPRYDGDGIAAFRLDTFWFREAMPAAHAAGWAALLVRFRRVRSVALTGFEADEASPRTIAEAECETADGVARLTVADIYGGHVEVAHEPEVRLLCLTWEGERVPIPDVAAV